MEGVELGTSALAALRTEIRTIHSQELPLWRRRTGGLMRKERRIEGQRVLLLDMPCGENLTLRDLLAENTCPEDMLLAHIPGDPRLARILAALAPEERAVVLALGLDGIVTWTGSSDHPRPTLRLVSELGLRGLFQ